MRKEDIQRLYDYNSWANARILTACTALTDEQFTRNLGSSFPSVRDTLVHILGAEWIWCERWHGRSHPDLPPGLEFPNLAAVRERWSEVQRNLAEFVASLRDEDLTRELSYQNTKGEAFTHPLWPALQHVVNHSTYHRGQVTTMLRQLGAKPVSTDLIAFYRERAASAGA